MAKRKPTEIRLTEAQRQKKVIELLRHRDRARRGYQAADKLLIELRAGGMQPGDQVQLPGDRTATLKDNFEGVDKVFKTASVSRFEIEVSYD